MRTEQVTCDTCGRDITSTGNCDDYRIVVASERLPPHWLAEGLSGGAVTAVFIPDPMPQSKHFCGKRCLRAWAVDTIPEPRSVSR